eukprot:PLAT2339.1.p1 GENE.PLAT2339.1~~PLAT2339.1.p1  ORF type:complete len:185 (-),score=35.65 PLAT2339.1:307-861(-)
MAEYESSSDEEWGGAFLDSEDIPYGTLQQHAPFVPTPRVMVDGVAPLAGITADDFVVDLGCGEGDVLLSIAQSCGLKRALGIDISDACIEKAKLAAEEAGLGDSVTYVVGDLFAEETRRLWSDATVIYIYLVPSMVKLLADDLRAAVARGVRLVCCTYLLPGEPPSSYVEELKLGLYVNSEEEM